MHTCILYILLCRKPTVFYVLLCFTSVLFSKRHTAYQTFFRITDFSGHKKFDPMDIL